MEIFEIFLVICIGSLSLFRMECIRYEKGIVQNLKEGVAICSLKRERTCVYKPRD